MSNNPYGAISRIVERRSAVKNSRAAQMLDISIEDHNRLAGLGYTLGIDSHGPYISGYGFSMGGSPDRIKEFVQEIFDYESRMVV